MYHGLYSEAVVSSVASAVALAEVGRFREAVEYVQRAAKVLYEAAKDVFEHVKITVQRLVELFVEAVTRVLAWMDEHKAYLFLMAAVAAGVVALSAALNLWGLVEMEKLAYAASLTPFVAAGVKEYSREEAFNILRSAPDPYEKFKKIVKKANVGRVKLAEPWESLRMLIMPTPSEERRLMMGKAYRELDERKKKALFYATLALEEAFGVYRSALKEVVEGLGKAVQMREVVGERVVRVADLEQIKQLAEKEEAAFKNALSTLRKRLNEYAVNYGLRDLLNVEEGKARELAEARAAELSKFNDVNFGVKAYAALIAYREYALGRRGVFGIAAWYWLEVGGSAWLLYYAPGTAYVEAIRAKAERPAAVEEMAAEALRRLFLKPGAGHYSRFVEELKEGGKLALMFEKETESSYVFRLYRIEEGGGLKELGIELWISRVGRGEEAGITYILIFDAERWRDFFRPELEAAVKTAVEVGGRLLVEDRLPYMAGWVASDVAISEGRLQMGTSHLWQLAETHALFGWSDIAVFRVSLTLEGPKPQFHARTSLEKLDEAIESSAKNGWLKMLGIKAESWKELRRWVMENWDVVVEAAVSRLREVLTVEELEKLLAPEGRDAPEGRRGGQRDGENMWEELRRVLNALRDELNDDKVAREVVAPVLLLIQAEKLGVNETTLKYLGAVISGAIDGDGYVSAAKGKVGLTSGEREIALLWKAALAAYGIKTKVEKAESAFHVVASGGDAVKLASLYFLYGHPLLKGDERIINHKRAEAVKLAAEGLNVSWERLRKTEEGLVAADLTISAGGAAVKYNVYLSEKAIELQFNSTDQSRVELAARLLMLAGISAEVKKREGRDVWYVRAATDMLAAGHEKLRKALAELVETARKSVGEEKAKRWLEKLVRGRVLKEGWPKYLVRLTNTGGLEVRYQSTSLNSIEREAQRLEKMGLKRGVHFTVKMPEGGGRGYVSILKVGLAYAAWLSVHGSGTQQELAAEFVEYILERAEKEGKEVFEKAQKIVEEGKAWGLPNAEGLGEEGRGRRQGARGKGDRRRSR